MHCEIIDRHFNVFFVVIQLKNDNLNSPKPVYRSPKWPEYVIGQYQMIKQMKIIECKFDNSLEEDNRNIDIDYNINLSFSNGNAL